MILSSIIYNIRRCIEIGRSVNLQPLIGMNFNLWQVTVALFMSAWLLRMFGIIFGESAEDIANDTENVFDIVEDDIADYE